jgi:hypothetical protein
MGTMKRYKPALYTLLAVIGLGLLHVLLILAMQRVTLPLGPTTPQGNSKLSLWILLYLSRDSRTTAATSSTGRSPSSRRPCRSI